MFRLNEQQTHWLLSLPESGMGYQRVETQLQGRTRLGVAYNADLLLMDDEPRTRLNRTYVQLLLEAKSVDSVNLKLIRVLSGSETRAVTKLAERDNKGPATDGEPRKTRAGERYARFTAYRDDRRIRPDRSLLPGTYATTKADADTVKTGAEAVERYALPDPKPAKYRFHIAPKEGNFYRQGIVQPDFGHAGGGVEILFDEGTNPGSVSGPDVLPES